MPIYEFKCMDCQNLFELLILSEDEGVDMKCPSCDSQMFERVMSTTNFSMGSAGGGGEKATSQTRTCSGGSCTIYEIPGPSR